MSRWMGKNVAVLMGGISKEREISLKTGTAVLNALKGAGYTAKGIDCTRRLPDQLKENKIEAAFIALHGPYGEDGAVQGLLEWLHIPYTGCGVLASALAMDKAVLNGLSRDFGFLVPKETVFDFRFEKIATFLARFKIPLPVVVKPSREGSSINIGIVREESKLKGALEKALQSDSKILVEEFIDGKEVTVSVLNGKALPSIEIVPKKGFYDYHNKYTKGMTEYIVPARISQKCQESINRVSEGLFRAIDADTFMRVDFIVSHDRERPFFLEVNTIPGMTETSLFPKAAAAAGISFESLCEMILEKAALKTGEKNEGDVG